jgi:hypothetical protein
VWEREPRDVAAYRTRNGQAGECEAGASNFFAAFRIHLAEGISEGQHRFAEDLK